MAITIAPNEIKNTDILRELGYTNLNINEASKLELDLRLNGNIIEVRAIDSWIPLNMCSDFLPDPNKPHKAEHWYGYDHLQVGDCCGIYDPLNHSNIGKIFSANRKIVNGDGSITFFTISQNPVLQPFKTPSLNATPLNPAILSSEFNGFFEFPNTAFSNDSSTICSTANRMTVYSNMENILDNSLTMLYMKSGSSLVPLTGAQYRFVKVGVYVYILDPALGTVLERVSNVNCGDNNIAETNDFGFAETFFGKDYQLIKISFKTTLVTVFTEWNLFFTGKDSSGNTISGNVQRTEPFNNQWREFVFDMSSNSTWNSGIIENVFFLFTRPQFFDLSVRNFSICSKDGLKAFSGVRNTITLDIPDEMVKNTVNTGRVQFLNTGNTPASGTTTIRVYFPNSNITYSNTTFAGYTYSFASNVLTITTNNVIGINQLINIPVNITSSLAGEYAINAKVWGGGDLVANSEANARVSNTEIVKVYDTLPCVPINSVSISGASVVDFDSTQTYTAFTNGGNYTPIYQWSVVGGTIIGANNAQSVVIRWDLSSASSGSVSIRVDNQCTSNVNATLGVSRAIYGNDYITRTLNKNNCPSGQFGTAYTTEIQANTYFAKTKVEANNLAIAQLDAVAQSNANAFGSCLINCNDITNVTISGQTTNVDRGVGYSYIANVTGGTGVIYQWSIANGTILGGQGSPSVTVSFDFAANGSSWNNGVLSVRVFQSCSTSERSTGITVQPRIYTASGTRTLSKNNCPSGFLSNGSIEYARTAQSAISQQVAQEELEKLFLLAQNEANSQLTCFQPTWGNERMERVYYPNCPANTRPDPLSYTHVIRANFYTSTISQADANQQAIDELNRLEINNNFFSCIPIGNPGVAASASVDEVYTLTNGPSNSIHVRVSISDGLGFVSFVEMFWENANQSVATSAPSSSFRLLHTPPAGVMTNPINYVYKVRLHLIGGGFVDIFTNSTIVNKDYNSGFAFLFGYIGRRNPLIGGARRLLTIRILPPLYLLDQSLREYVVFVRWRTIGGAWNNLVVAEDRSLSSNPRIVNFSLSTPVGSGSAVNLFNTRSIWYTNYNGILGYDSNIIREVVLRDEVLDSQLSSFSTIQIELRFLSQVSDLGNRWTSLSPAFIYTVNYQDLNLE